MRLLLILSILLIQAVPARSNPGLRWRPASFRGLTVGRSRRADMLRVLGRPEWSRAHESEGDRDAPREVWNHYGRVGEFPGSASVVVDGRSGVITRIEFYPERLTREQVVAHFGPGYVVTRYDLDQCGGDEDSESLYESPAGPITSVEYRPRGIAILVGYKDMVTKISYVAGPVGATHSRCKGAPAHEAN